MIPLVLNIRLTQFDAGNRSTNLAIRAACQHLPTGEAEAVLAILKLDDGLAVADYPDWKQVPTLAKRGHKRIIHHGPVPAGEDE